MNSQVFSGANILTPGGVVQGSIVAECGRIAAVTDFDYPGSVDLRGALVIPGIIDMHNDGLEGEVNPRPGAGIPLEIALSNFDRRAAASGITMAFHAITFAELEKKERSVEGGDTSARMIRALDPQSTAVEHRVLFRADVWHPEGLDALLERAAGWDIRLVTLNDHTPGQGQYRDLDVYRSAVQKWVQLGNEAATEDHIEAKVSVAREHPERAEETFARIREARASLGLLIGSHDDDSPERCQFMHELGASIAEFPVTIEAAARARELNMTIVAGAPNVVRGASHSGNVAALDLIRLGLCDVLVADYHAPSLLLAVQALAGDGVLGLAEAVQLVSTNPARAIGRGDLGTIEVGKAATLTLVDANRKGPWRPLGIIRDGILRARFFDHASDPVPA